ncbi:uncharacterized protein YecE (DUF72 family) [Cellulophaga sp. RHA19]|uniref:DUF72 domain-containing protein n=1 Tax=Cellulophaga sp. RHA19 TaxID=1798237 RepID=UPI000C2BE76F|nr:DUF72 domain-containing protein [Cellulophaga sp. RHA19]PKB44298.1 uncharacterized protein YecE (DUF72 family) [Cellulophaga sp. RHA19]
MKFGKVTNPELLNLKLPKDHIDTAAVLKKVTVNSNLNISVGCAKWNKQDLKNFYPKGTKDELKYYASQFNSIELNATFYRIFPAEQYQKWYDKTPEDFKFYPKITNEVSHLNRLNNNVYPILDRYLQATSTLKEKLGTIFLQLHTNFDTKEWDKVVQFVKYWPKEFKLAIEFRHPDWFANKTIAQELYYLLQENNIANTIVDTAGRRDLLHMRLTNNEAFVRFVGANHKSDYDRLEEWTTRLENWKEKGLKNIHFFVHQNMELESPLLSASFIASLNKKVDSNLKIPKTLLDNRLTLF